MKIRLLFFLLLPLLVTAQEEIKNPPVTQGACCCADSVRLCNGAVNGAIKSNDNVILIDVNGKNISVPKRTYQRGDPVWVKVVNYNPFLYKLKFDNKDSTIPARNDGKLLSWFIDPSNISSIVAGLTATSITSAGLAAQDAIQKQHAYQWQNSGGNKMSVVDNDINTFETNEKKAIKIVLKYQKESGKLADSIYRVNNNIARNMYNLSRRLNFLNDVAASCANFSGLETLELAIEDSFANMRNAVQQLIPKVRTEKDEYLNNIAFFRSDMEKNWSIRVADSLLLLLYGRSIQLLEKMDSTLSYTELKKTIEAIEGIRMLSTCYISLPQYFSADSKTIDIFLTPWKDSSRLVSYSTSLQIPWEQNKIYGISAGVYVSTLHNNGYSTAASKRTVGGVTDTVYNLVSDNPGSIEFGVNALGYCAWRVSSSTFMGLSFGAGMSIESKPKPRLFLGGELVFGNRNRFLIAPGLIIGYVQRLSEAYSGKTDFTALPSGYMKDFISAGFQLSVHYSFL